MNGNSFVIAQIGSRRIALPGEGVSELISAPSVHSFPHTTPLVAGVVVRRGRILPVIDLGPGINGEASPPTRFFLVVDRRVGGRRDRCAIPVQGECELVSGSFTAAEHDDRRVLGWVAIDGETLDVLELEHTIAAGSSSGGQQAAKESS